MSARRWCVSALAACAAIVVAACGSAGPSGPVTAKAYAPSPSSSSSSGAGQTATAGSAGYSGDPGADWNLAWSDDFTGSSGLKGWTFLSGGNGWGNKELQLYDSRNASIAPGGGLAITASRDGYGQECWYGSCSYSGARMETAGGYEPKYGLIEARIKLPSGAGLWPAFWLEGANVNQVGWPAAGEIDVIEVNNMHPDLVEAFAHGTNENYGTYHTLSDSLSAGYHVYGIDWTAKGITWLVDGHAYGHISAYPGWPFDQQFSIILDLAVGGVWPGSPNASTKFPAQMDVSWVRVYQQKS